jgi:hypothetical protein
MCHRLRPSSRRPDNGERSDLIPDHLGRDVPWPATGPSGMGGGQASPPPSSVPRSLTLRTAHSTHVNGSADRVLWLADPYTRTGIRGRPARPRGSNFARCAPDRSLARLSSRAGAGRNTRGNPPARCYGGRAAAPRRRDAENLCEEVSEPQVEQHWQDQLGLELRVAGRPGRTAGAGLFAVGAEVVVTTVCC